MEGDQQLRPPGRHQPSVRKRRACDTAEACLSTASDSILVALVGNTESGSIIGTGSNS
jgi:hypothetical protein